MKLKADKYGFPVTYNLKKEEIVRDKNGKKLVKLYSKAGKLMTD